MKEYGWRPAQASALAMGLALAGCGAGNSGGLASTPTPTPPPASYTKIADMSGDRTFQTAGVRFVQTSSNSVTFPNTLPLGNAVKVAYTAANDAYTLTATDGSTVSFEPTNVTASPAPNVLRWDRTAGPVHDTFTLTVPSVDGIALSYTIVGSWLHSDGTAPLQTLNRLAVGGAPTLAGDMPRTGIAAYSAALTGFAVRPGLAPFILGNSSTATFSADFASNTVATSLVLAGTPAPNGTSVTTFGTFNGTGTISTTGPGFSGTLDSPDVSGATGGFAGAFFGPKAQELAYSWYATAPNIGFYGTVAGIKK